MMNQPEIYRQSRESIVDYTGGDVTSSILKEYATTGVYTVLSCLRSIGLSDAKIQLIALPDFTFSRNDLRYKAGFPYGTIMHIDVQGNNFIPLGFRPNCCGIAMVRIKQNQTDISMIKQRLEKIETLSADISSDDLKRGNHFVGCYYDVCTNEHFAIIHGSFSSVKTGHKEIPGLYIDKTNYWDSDMQVYETERSQCHYLIGEAALSYYAAYMQHENHTKALRAMIADYLFPSSEMVFNETHEGFFSENTIVLGAYALSRPYICPIMLASETDLPILQVYLPIPELPFPLYACPHGGGYDLQHITSGCFDSEIHIYRLLYQNGALMETGDIRKLIFDYRHNTDFIWSDKYGFCSVQRRLQTKFNLKL